MVFPLFDGSKVTGQLAAQLFCGQVGVIPSLFHLQGADERFKVHFQGGICIWSLFLSTLNMKSKELSLSAISEASHHYVKHQNKPSREIAKTLGSSATPKDQEDHIKQMWWMTEKLFSW